MAQICYVIVYINNTLRE